MKPPVKNFNFLKYPYGDCTQWFGENPLLYASLFLKGHNGIDIVRPFGEHLFAVEGGIICDLKDDPDGYGRHIRILTEPDKFGVRKEWTYGHLSHINVTLGQRVNEGQFVGTMGNSGFVVSGETPYWDNNPYRGTHLHLGLRHIEDHASGWSYQGSTLKVRCLNYDNGFKGAIDPLPLFATPKALKVARLADKSGDKLLWNLAKVFYTIGI